MVLPILGCSVVAFAVFVERMIFFSKMKAEEIFLKKYHHQVFSGKKGEVKVIVDEMTGTFEPLISYYYNFTFNGLSVTASEIKQATEDIARGIVQKIERFAGVISTVATIAPMLGLLGTVTGMMKSFSGLSKLGPSARDVLASGITEALITTALGLMVAIPSIMLYNYMVSKIDLLLRDVELLVNDILSNNNKDK